MQKIPTPVFAANLTAMRSVCLEGQGRVSELFLLDGKRDDPGATGPFGSHGPALCSGIAARASGAAGCSMAATTCPFP